MTESVDIMKQFISQFQKENVMGFFQFYHSFQGQKNISGLCKIAKAKKESANMKYLSLVFLVDTPDAESKKSMDDLLNKLSSSTFQKHCPALESVTPMPPMNATPESYVKHLDIMLNPSVNIDKDFVENELCPAIRSTTNFTATEDLIWWDDINSAEKLVKDRSIFDKIRRFFKSSK